MVSLVLDASVALAWCLDDEESGVADLVLDRVVRDGAVVPAVWPLEVANGLRTAERRGRITPADAIRAGLALRRLPIEVERADLEHALDTCAVLARRLDLSTYDAAYLALAIGRHLPLATQDARLADAGQRAGVEMSRP